MSFLRSVTKPPYIHHHDKKHCFQGNRIMLYYLAFPSTCRDIHTYIFTHSAMEKFTLYSLNMLQMLRSILHAQIVFQ